MNFNISLACVFEDFVVDAWFPINYDGDAKEILAVEKLAEREKRTRDKLKYFANENERLIPLQYFVTRFIITFYPFEFVRFRFY